MFGGGTYGCKDILSSCLTAKLSSGERINNMINKTKIELLGIKR